MNTKEAFRSFFQHLNRKEKEEIRDIINDMCREDDIIEIEDFNCKELNELACGQKVNAIKLYRERVMSKYSLSTLSLVACKNKADNTQVFSDCRVMKTYENQSERKRKQMAPEFVKDLGIWSDLISSGNQKLWKVNDGYYVTSAANVMFSGPETFVFGADENGEITSFGELEGSIRGELDHEKAIRGFCDSLDANLSH